MKEILENIRKEIDSLTDEDLQNIFPEKKYINNDFLQNFYYLVLEEGRTDFIFDLQKKGAKIRPNDVEIPLKKGNFEMVEFLVETVGVDVTDATVPLLSTAISMKDYKSIALFLIKGIEPENEEIIKAVGLEDIFLLAILLKEKETVSPQIIREIIKRENGFLLLTLQDKFSKNSLNEGLKQAISQSSLGLVNLLLTMGSHFTIKATKFIFEKNPEIKQFFSNDSPNYKEFKDFYLEYIKNFSITFLIEELKSLKEKSQGKLKRKRTLEIKELLKALENIKNLKPCKENYDYVLRLQNNGLRFINLKIFPISK